jgi:hypothetical protein
VKAVSRLSLLNRAMVRIAITKYLLEGRMLREIDAREYNN